MSKNVKNLRPPKPVWMESARYAQEQLLQVPTQEGEVYGVVFRALRKDYVDFWRESKKKAAANPLNGIYTVTVQEDTQLLPLAGDGPVDGIHLKAGDVLRFGGLP